MEIHGQPKISSTSGLRSVGEGRTDFTRPNRDAIHDTTEPLRFDNADRIDFSERATMLAAQSSDSTNDAADAERAERLEALRSAFQKGTLNDQARVERAATKLLGGE